MPAEREGERDEVELDEAALLGLVIGDVHGLEERLHAGIGTPQRDRQRDDEGEAQRPALLRRQPVQLLPQDVQAAAGDDALERGEVLFHRRRVGEEAVDRHQSREGGDEGEQQVEGGAGRDQQHAVLADLVLHAGEDVLPARPGDLGRLLGLAPAPRLSRPFLLGRRSTFPLAACRIRLRLLKAGGLSFRSTRHCRVASASPCISR